MKITLAYTQPIAYIQGMKNKYDEMAEAVVAKAKAILASGQNVNPTMDTAGMSEIGKHVFGKVNDYSFSPEVAAKSALSEGYSKFTALVAKLNREDNADWKLASAAQDIIGDAAEEMGMPL